MLDKILEDMRNVEVENPQLPCNNCGGDCCGANVLFTENELRILKKNYKSKFKKLKLVESNIPGSYMIKRKGTKAINDADKCIFLENDKCSVYEHRPRICKDFGNKMYIKCPFDGMASRPHDEEIEYRLAVKTRKLDIEFMTSYTNERTKDIAGMKPIRIRVDEERT